MKRLSIILVLLLIITISFAQKSKVNIASASITSGKYDQAKTAIDEAMTNEATANWPKTFFVKGQVYQAIHESPLPMYKDLDKDALIKAYEAYLKSYQLGEVPDEKGKVKNKFKKEILTNFKTLKLHFLNYAIDGYNKQIYKQALLGFEKALEIDTFPTLVYVDTTVMFNAGLAAFNANEYNKALVYFDKVQKLNYSPSKVELYKGNSYKALGDTAKAISTYQNAVTKYPEDNQMALTELINIYLVQGNTNEALKFLDLAIKQDPKNYSYYFAQGTLFDKLQVAASEKAKESSKQVTAKTKFAALQEAYKNSMMAKKNNPKIKAQIKAKEDTIVLINKEVEVLNKSKENYLKEIDDYNQKAVGSYKKSLEIKPDYFNSNYNLGALFYNKAARILEEANNIPLKEKERFDLEVGKANDEFKNALPFMEGAHKSDPKEKSTMQTLYTIYYKLQMLDKAKAIKEQLDALK